MDLSLLDQRSTGTHDHRLHQHAPAADRASRQPRGSAIGGFSGSPVTPPAAAAAALAGSTGARACHCNKALPD